MKHAVLVTGGTAYDREDRIDAELTRFPDGTLLIQGGAKGADGHAARLGDRRSFFIATVPYAGFLGRRGGPARNAKMVDLLAGLRAIGYECHVLAFGGDAGTDDCVRQARRADFIAEEFDR